MATKKEQDWIKGVDKWTMVEGKIYNRYRKGKQNKALVFAIHRAFVEGQKNPMPI